MKIKFWGTRGSLPAPLTAGEVKRKVTEAVRLALEQKVKSEEIETWVDKLPFNVNGTFGGNTTCVEVVCMDGVLVIDLGSGIREFGKAILPDMFLRKGLTIHFLMSHVHWDHTQGFPFFAPIFISRKVLPNNKFIFYGGTQWQKTLEEVLRGQMDPPAFPIEWEKIIAEGPEMEFHTIYNGYEKEISKINLSAKRLHHPNETYGWRIEHQGKVFVFASDTEPYPTGPDPVLIELAKEADVLYLDGQYSLEQYKGQDGPPRLGWGHGYDRWCGEVAKAAKVKLLLIGHHDPSNDDEKIAEIVNHAKEVFKNTYGAYDGLELCL